MNEKDPLIKASPNAERELFTLFAHAATGYSLEQVIGAAVNIVVNALRQVHATQPKAIADFDQLMAKTRELISLHYDNAGRRRNVFPFHQTIEMPLFDARKHLNNGKLN
jgi:selenocysteine lyase/cysteine desulfurase